MNPLAHLAPRWHLARSRMRRGSYAGLPSTRLPFHETPVVATYLHTGFFFGMLSRDRPYDALLNIHIQLSAPRRRADRLNLLPLKLIPAMAPCELGLQEVRDWTPDEIAAMRGPGLVTTIAQALQGGEYLYANLNYFYLPGTDFHRRHHFRQSVLVTGFDAAAGEFTIACYLKNGNFGMTRMPASLLADAFFSPLGRLNSSDASQVNRLCGMRNTAAAPTLPLDFNAIKWQLVDYLESTYAAPNRVDDQRIRRWHLRYDRSTAEDTWYGLDVYQGIAALLRSPEFQATRKIDFRITRLLWEHKKLMTIRIRRLEEQGVVADGGLLERWQGVERLAWTLHFGLFRAMAKNEAIDPAGVERAMGEIADRERDLLGRLRDALP